MLNREESSKAFDGINFAITCDDCGPFHLLHERYNLTYLEAMKIVDEHVKEFPTHSPILEPDVEL